MVIQLVNVSVRPERRSGGDWQAGRKHLHLFRESGIEEILCAPAEKALPG